jgi:hypothetical protein
MPIVLAILKPLGEIGLSMLMALLTGPVIKRLVIRFVEAEANKYAKRASETEEQSDDETARMLQGVVADIKKAWGIE